MTVHRYSLLVVLALGALSCTKKPPPNKTPPAASVASPPADTSLPMKTRRGGMDVTFAVVSDTHFGFDGIEKDNARLIERVNALGGRDYPPKIGGHVGNIRGLAITGDLTEWGREDEWASFVAAYGLTGTESRLKVPVFEMIGNHDKVALGPWLGDQVGARHGGRFYSWDWDDLHLVALGEAPDDASLAFLTKDLAHVAPDVPVILLFHLALLGPWSTDNWFDDTYKERLRKTIEGHFVAAIFHGHHHATGHYTWNGIDVWKPGAVKNGAHTIAVVHATDFTWTLASYDWDKEQWASTFEKPLAARPAK